MVDLSRFSKKADPSAKGKGRAGVLPAIEGIERALVTLDEAVAGRMEHQYQHGRPKGQTTHNKYLDPIFKWMPGYTNVITGWPGHGKSQLFFELLLLRAVFEGKKSAVYPSENLPAETFFNGLIHTLTGRPGDRSVSNHLNQAEYRRAREFVKEHFFLVDPPAGMPYTPAHLLAYFQYFIDKYGVEHSMIDPWNKCDHSSMGRMGGYESYLTHTVGLCTKWSQETKQCLIITAHPKRAEENMGYAQKRPVPTGGHISGGQTWENMAHYIGAMHRPYADTEGNFQAAYYTHKCKAERDVARRGNVGAEGFDGAPPMVPVQWDEVQNRYRWGYERWSPFDAQIVRQLYAAPKEAPAPQLFTAAPPPTTVAPVAPATLPPITVASAFDTPSEFDTLPADRLPNGARAIRLPHANE